MTTKHHHDKSIAESTADKTEPTKAKDVEAARSASETAPVITGFGVMFAHVTWFFAGPVAVLLTLISIASAGTGWATALDAVFFVIVGLMIWCRWFDQHSGQSTLSDGKPSAWADCRRYMLWMPVVAGVAWIVANVMGNHFVRMWSG